MTEQERSIATAELTIRELKDDIDEGRRLGLSGIVIAQLETVVRTGQAALDEIAKENRHV